MPWGWEGLYLALIKEEFRPGLSNPLCTPHCTRAAPAHQAVRRRRACPPAQGLWVTTPSCPLSLGRRQAPRPYHWPKGHLLSTC